MCYLFGTADCNRSIFYVCVRVELDWEPEGVGGSFWEPNYYRAILYQRFRVEFGVEVWMHTASSPGPLIVWLRDVLFVAFMVRCSSNAVFFFFLFRLVRAAETIIRSKTRKRVGFMVDSMYYLGSRVSSYVVGLHTQLKRRRGLPCFSCLLQV